MSDTTRSSEHVPAQPQPSQSPARAVEAPQVVGDLGNMAIAQYVRGGGSVASFAGAPADNQESNHARQQALARASRSAASGSPAPVVVPPPVRAALSGAEGTPLADAGRWSSRVGSDVSDARVVTGSAAADAAAAVDARAFTVGNRVFMGAGNDAGTDGGNLLAHELTHVAQQRGAPPPGSWDQLPMLGRDHPHEVAARARDGAPRAPSTLAIARDPEPDLDLHDYRKKYADNIGDGIDAFIRDAKLEIGPSFGAKFITIPASPPLPNLILGGLRGAALDAKLDELLSQPKVETAIEKARVHGRQLVQVSPYDRGTVSDAKTGPNRWYPDVAMEIGVLIVQAMHESLARMVPRYVSAAIALAAAEEAENQRTDMATAPQVSAGDLVASSPMDELVVDNALVPATFDYHNFRIASPDAKGKVGELHEVAVTWEAPRDGTFWARVTRTDDPKAPASAEDVAMALFGTPAKSARLVVLSPPLFGFGGGSDLLPEWQEQLKAMGVTDFARQGDPEEVAKADGPLHEEMAKRQGADIPTKAVTKLDVLRLIDDSMHILDSIDASGATYDTGKDPVPGTAAVRTKLTERHAQIMAGSEADAQEWAGHAQGQRDVLVQASFAMQGHAKRLADLTKFETDAAAKAGGSLPPFARLALQRVAAELANAVASSDLPAIAAQLLARAEDDAGQLPIELADGMLAAIRRQIDDARESKRKEDGDHDAYDVDGLRDRQEQLEYRLARVRELLQTDPAAATKELAAIQRDMSELGHESQMVADMDQIDATWQAVVDAISVYNEEKTDARLGILKWRGEDLHKTWKLLYQRYRDGTADKKHILEELEKLRTGGQLSRWLGEVRVTVKNAQVQAMVGKFVALIVITVVTDGLGDVVLAGAEGWGLSAGAARLAAGGAEAIAFTTLNQIFLDDDHHIGHVAFDLGANLVMFGAMRRFAMFAETAKLSQGVASTSQIVLMAGMTFVGAELEKARTDGRMLNRSEVAELFAQGLIQAIALHAVAPTLKEKLFGDLESATYAFASRLRANNATWEALKLDANALHSAKDLAAAQDYIAKERAWLQERLALLDEIARKTVNDESLRTRLKLEPDQIREMRTPVVDALRSLDDPMLMANLEPMGPGMFSCPADSFDVVIQTMHGRVVATTRIEGARTAEVKLPDGKVIKVTEVVDGAAEWLRALRGKLTPEQQVALLELGDGVVPPRTLYALLGGEVESARHTLDLARLRTSEHAAPGAQDKVPLPQDVRPESWAELQSLIREHGVNEGLRQWHELQSEEINATIVPGSEFKGTGRSVAEPEKVVAKASTDLRALTWLFKDRVASMVINGPEVTIGLRNGKTLKVAIMATDLPYVQVARTKVNTQRSEHTIQLSNKIADDQIQRALAHEIGEIIAATDEAADPKRRDPRNRLGTSDIDTRGDGQLSPHDWGRAAELNLLASQLKEPTLEPAKRAGLRRELTALVDELGLRAGTAGAHERQQALVTEGALSPDALGELYDPLNGLTRAAEQLAPEDKAIFDALADSTDKQNDLMAMEDFRTRGKKKLDPLAVSPEDLNADGRVKPEAMERIARNAAIARANKSAEMILWLYQLNASRPIGAKYATLDMPVWIGGGAATAGLTRDTLFIDARGRWQVDANSSLAQTAGQLSGLRDAGMGDPSSFAAPDQRVPLQAIRAFEDNLASQARVVNGVASISMESGLQVLTIRPVAGPEVKFYLGGGSRVAFAPGFPRETLPGQRMAFPDALRVVRNELATKGVDVDALIGEHGQLTDADAIQVRRLLRKFEGDITSPEAKEALNVLSAAGEWAKARSAAPEKIMRGDEANVATNFATSGVRDWVISGQGGTAISAAENILRQTEAMNPPVKVRMMGRDTPAGLASNTQWQQVFAKYGPSGEGRLSVETVQRIDDMVVKPNGGVSGVKVVDSAGATRLVTGEGYIQSMGRFNTLPDPIAGQVSKVYNEQHGSSPVAGSRVEGQLLWGPDGQYLGYRVKVTQGGATNTYDVTGARSRFLPPELFPNKTTRELVQPERGSTTNPQQTAQGRDAPSNSGTFAGGLEASATQSSEYGINMSNHTVAVMDADGNFPPP